VLLAKALKRGLGCACYAAMLFTASMVLLFVVIGPAQIVEGVLLIYLFIVATVVYTLSHLLVVLPLIYWFGSSGFLRRGIASAVGAIVPLLIFLVSDFFSTPSPSFNPSLREAWVCWMLFFLAISGALGARHLYVLAQGDSTENVT
jgi:hypothetical protein